jgi:hypothetical protein
MAQKKLTIEKLAERSQQESWDIKKMLATKEDVTLIISAIENLSGQIGDVKQSTRNAFDYARLQGHVDVIQKQLDIKS